MTHDQKNECRKAFEDDIGDVYDLAKLEKSCTYADENTRSAWRHFKAGWEARVQPDVTALVEALRFYADKENWKLRINDGPPKEVMPMAYFTDTGSIARAALAKFERKAAPVTVLVTVR